jgi:amidohydrolase
MGRHRSSTGDPDTGKRLLARARVLEPDLIELRRCLHRRPELGFQEVQTRRRIRECIATRSRPVEFSESDEAGLVARLGDQPVVALRACLDALPVPDQTGAPYASEVPGTSHACGHDAQAAVLAGATILLAEEAQEAPVLCLFQPAEEIDTGARSVLASGVLDGSPLGTIVGFHGHPGLPAGQIGVSAGPVMACITTVRCRIKGSGSHGAEPHLGHDPIASLAALVSDWQVALGRRTDGRDAVVLSVGRIAAGTTANVVPAEAELEGTLRYLKPELGPQLAEVLLATARGVEARFGTVIELQLDEVVPALVNDEAVAGLVAEAAAEVVGPDAVGPALASLGGDDFAFLLQRAPGCYFFLGERQQGRAAYGWHDPAYDLDEASIAVGSAVLALAALRAVERRSA